MNRTAVLSASALGVLIFACGSLDSNTGSAPTLATIEGTLSNSAPLDVPRTSDVRVAVVWRGDGGQFNVAEDLPVQPVFPFKFTIALDGPPPEEAMNSEVVVSPPQIGPSAGGPPPSSGTGGPATGAAPDAPDGAVVPATAVILLDTPAVAPASRYAIGTVVAYLDDNHNGKLDLVADNASAYVDQILAANQQLTIAYFEGPVLKDWPPGYRLVDAKGRRPKEGYNLLQIPVCTPERAVTTNPACTSPPPVNPGGCTPLAWLGMDAPYALDISTSPEVAMLMCLGPSGPEVGEVGSGPGGPFDPSIQPAKYPDPCDPNLSCAPDGSDYLFATCMEISQGLCKDTLKSCTSVGYARPTPAPPDWPCAK